MLIRALTEALGDTRLSIQLPNLPDTTDTAAAVECDTPVHRCRDEREIMGNQYSSVGEIGDKLC